MMQLCLASARSQAASGMVSRRPDNDHQLPLQVKLQAMFKSGELVQYVDLVANTTRPMNVVGSPCLCHETLCQLCCC
jgi:hypothetical protein